MNTRILLHRTALAASLALLFGSTNACSTGSDATDRGRGSQAAPARPAVPPPIAELEVSAYETALKVSLPETQPEEIPGLHNVYRLGDSIVSGAEQHDENAFRRLQDMGVRTILSVDGKVPDEELAAKYGMKYVHVPIQYRGITEDELTKIAKTFREQPGPFYVHCFHGQHRGPAAAEVGRLVLDGIPRELAIAEMRQWCGTSGSYEGLYQTIAAGDIPDAERTQALDWDFPAAQTFEGFRSAMVELSRADDNLKYLSKRQWLAGAEHPDADPLNEAAKLATVFRATAAIDTVLDRPADFLQWMEQSVGAADELCDTIRAWKTGEVELEAVDAAYGRVRGLCTSCHSDYRN